MSLHPGTRHAAPLAGKGVSGHAVVFADAMGRPSDPVAATLDRLARAGVDGVGRARAGIHAVLTRVVADSQWPDIAERFSWLTNTGIPIEFAWTSRDAAIRWTAEVAPPEFPDHRRLAAAGELAFGASDAVAEQLALLARLQSGRQLRFGAWLGVRHRNDADEQKVYAEVPELRASDLVKRLGLPIHPSVRTVGLRSRMVGLFGDGAMELYTRSHELDRRVVEGLERSAFGRGGRLWPAVRALAGERLPRPSGVSITFGPDGAPLAITWFSFAKAVFGSDAAVAAALSGRTPSASSRAVLAALVPGEAAGGRWHCGMVGVGVAAQGGVWFQVGTRPHP